VTSPASWADGRGGDGDLFDMTVGAADVDAVDTILRQYIQTSDAAHVLSGDAVSQSPACRAKCWAGSCMGDVRSSRSTSWPTCPPASACP